MTERDSHSQFHLANIDKQRSYNQTVGSDVEAPETSSYLENGEQYIASQYQHDSCGKCRKHISKCSCSTVKTSECCELRYNVTTYYPCCIRWKPCALLAEFLGAFILVFIGAMSTLVSGSTLVVIAFAHGLILFGLISALGPLSGGHFNPAVTFGMWLCGHVNVWASGLYVLAQLVGSIVAGVLVLVFFDASTGLGTPQPVGSFSAGTAFVAEFFGTLILVAHILFGVESSPNVGWTIGAVFVALEFVFVPISGGAFNFVRFFGPAIFSGEWGSWWVYLFAPWAGACAAVLIYKACMILKCHKRFL